MTDELYCGHTSCAGCPATIAIRSIMKAAGKDVIISNATSCSEIISTPYPLSSWPVPYIHVAFECAPAVAGGIEAAQKKLERTAKIIVLAGDGSTYDIGLQSLSGMVDRGHDVLYICYDNECYSNTGVQRSSATPFAAWTTTSPNGEKSIGNKTFKKPVAEMMIAQGAVYVATSSIGYPKDIQEKVKKALSIKGPKFLLIHAPCPLAWKFDASKTVEIAKIAVETGMWAMYEYCDEKRTISIEPLFKPVSEYFRLQGRFKHITDKEISQTQEHIKKYWDRLKKY
ncbi:MAG: pyruvate synthase subunit beta [Candidatus Aenigmarchaeota archaeon]|nr:pyruvate synthase subunit beta [Candidatus Aenigmarchaeota archaeon]